ncbi:hypothetical protein BDV18DRAFT_164537 [Aspergillus unguis]
MAIRSVVLAGSTGTLAPAILSALLSSRQFSVTIFTRDEQNTHFPRGVNVIRVDYASVADMTTKLRGQDAVISTLPIAAGAAQRFLICAAAAAGVKRFIPSEYGSRAVNWTVPAYTPKRTAQSLLESFAKENKLSYTIICCGVLLDWGLEAGSPISLTQRTAELHDGGERVYSTTTLGTVARVVVQVLRLAEQTENRVIQVAEAHTTLRELLAVAQDVVGRDEWRITMPNTQKVAEEAMKQIKKHDLDHLTVMPFLAKGVWGRNGAAHFEKTDNELMGVQLLDRAGLKRVVEMVMRKQVMN